MALSLSFFGLFRAVFSPLYSLILNSDYYPKFTRFEAEAVMSKQHVFLACANELPTTLLHVSNVSGHAPHTQNLMCTANNLFDCKHLLEVLICVLFCHNYVRAREH